MCVIPNGFLFIQHITLSVCPLTYTTIRTVSFAISVDNLTRFNTIAPWKIHSTWQVV